jgi:rhomboid family GlyGly-CTERM serine protease
MSARSPVHKLARWVVPAGFSSLILLTQAGGEQLYASLRYDRAAVLDGEWWRLFTAHFVHLGWAHCLLNLVGLALCVMFASCLRPLRAWAGALTVLPLGIGLLLLLVSPEVANYAGLSGVLYGLFILALAPAARRGDALAWIALAAVSARIGWQMLDASAAEKSALFNGYVVAQGHLYGAISATAMVLWRTLRKKPPHLC